MKVMASVLQLLVLLSFCRCGRTPQEGLEDESSIKARGRSEAMLNRNYDGVSQHLYTYSELSPFFQATPGWLDGMRDLMLAWSEDVLQFCRNSQIKSKLNK